LSGRGILSGVFHATLLRGLLLSEFLEKPLYESFYQANSLKGIKVADPFIGGGTSLLEANRLGCEIAGFQIGSIAGNTGNTD
jgi:putative DNA methylase